MTILANARHERFARAIVAGKTADEAYKEAGFKPDRGNATRLTAKDSVKARVEELQQRAAAKVSVTREWVLEQLLDNAKLAKAAGDYGPSNRALELVGKELSMFVEKQEVGKPGEFEELTTEQKRERAITLAEQLGLTNRSATSGTA